MDTWKLNSEHCESENTPNTTCCNIKDMISTHTLAVCSDVFCRCVEWLGGADKAIPSEAFPGATKLDPAQPNLKPCLGSS